MHILVIDGQGGGLGAALVVMGPLGLLAANSLMGEVSPAIAAALSRTEAKRILIPVSSTCGILVASAAGGKLEELLDNAVDLAAKEVEAK